MTFALEQQPADCKDERLARESDSSSTVIRLCSFSIVKKKKGLQQSLKPASECSFSFTFFGETHMLQKILVTVCGKERVAAYWRYRFYEFFFPCTVNICVFMCSLYTHVYFFPTLYIPASVSAVSGRWPGWCRH